MISQRDPDWQQANQHFVLDAVDTVREALERHIARAKGEKEPSPKRSPSKANTPREAHQTPMALERLCQAFDLSAFERDLLLLCAGVELGAGFSALCAEAQGSPHASLGLALAVLPEAYWSAIAPSAPLRRWHLVQLESGSSLMQSALRIDERILHYLVGAGDLDRRLTGLLQPVSAVGIPLTSHAQLAEQISRVWHAAAARGETPLIQLCGREAATRSAIAVAVSAELGKPLYRVSSAALPSAAADLELWLDLWVRETLLTDCALLLECESFGEDTAARALPIAQTLERIGGLVFVSSPERFALPRRAFLAYDVEGARLEEQETLWREIFGADASGMEQEIARLVSHFDLDEQTIHAVGLMIAGAETTPATGGEKSASPVAAPDTPETRARQRGAAAWNACRTLARPRLDDLAQRIPPHAAWDDLILPEAQSQILHAIAAQVRQRYKVYQTWGFAESGTRGLGISALFAGESGTGKTTAAEVLAGELQLDLYKIDLSAVISKYIGETEKNLRQVFHAAEAGGAILLFDEADALFGKRSDVKDSHDRHANIEVSYLLQRIEAYRGLAILTTNMRSALDTAFLRRLRFIVQFPYPTVAERERIWQRVFPARTATDGLCTKRLAQLEASGGVIRNVALNAAFLAADADEPVRMLHIYRAAQYEYAKLERSVTEAETQGWLA